MANLYKGMAGSPITSLSAAITSTQTSITVDNGSALPDAPNICTIIGDNAQIETVLYTAKSGDVLSGVTRGVEGTAKAWDKGTKVARYFTAYDQNAIIQQFATLATPEWHELPLINDWTGSIKYCKNAMGIVSIRGYITSETMTALTYVSENLPAEYSPYVHTAMQSVQYFNGISSSSIFYLVPNRGVMVSHTTNFEKGETYAISCIYQV